MDQMLKLIVTRILADDNNVYDWKIGENYTKEEVLAALDRFKEIIQKTPENYWHKMGV